MTNDEIPKDEGMTNDEIPKDEGMTNGEIPKDEFVLPSFMIPSSLGISSSVISPRVRSDA